MDLPIYCDDTKKQLAIYAVEVIRDNINGNPDAGGRPRQALDGRGLCTDVAIKSRLNTYVEAVYGSEKGYELYIKYREGIALNDLHKEAIDSTGNAKDACEYMRKRYSPVRWFGAVMTTGFNCGQVRGPIQLDVAESVDLLRDMRIWKRKIEIWERSSSFPTLSMLAIFIFPLIGQKSLVSPQKTSLASGKHSWNLGSLLDLRVEEIYSCAVSMCLRSISRQEMLPHRNSSSESV